MRRVLILTTDDLNFSPRARAMIECFSGDFEITVCARRNLTLENYRADSPHYTFVEYIEVPPLMRPKFHHRYPAPIRKFVSAALLGIEAAKGAFPKIAFENSLWNSSARAMREKLKRVSYDYIVVHHIWNLPVAIAISREHTRIILNAHEFYTEQFTEQNWVRGVKPYYEYVANNYLRRADLVVTVADGIAERYIEDYGVKAVVLKNAKHLVNMSPSPTRAGTLRLVHHGIAAPARRIENYIELIDLLDERFTMHFFLVPVEGHGRYFDAIERRIRGHKRIVMSDPVPSEKIVSAINEFDIGLMLFEPSSFNLQHFLPNKFFEFIQARLAIATWPSMEISGVVKDYGLGVVSETFSLSSIADELNGLSEEAVKDFKMNCHVASAELSLEGELAKLREVIEAL